MIPNEREIRKEPVSVFSKNPFFARTPKQNI
jgi:hypothetical protein